MGRDGRDIGRMWSAMCCVDARPSCGRRIRRVSMYEYPKGMRWNGRVDVIAGFETDGDGTE